MPLALLLSACPFMWTLFLFHRCSIFFHFSENVNCGFWCFLFLSLWFLLLLSSLFVCLLLGFTWGIAPRCLAIVNRLFLFPSEDEKNRPTSVRGGRVSCKGAGWGRSVRSERKRDRDSHRPFWNPSFFPVGSNQAVDVLVGCPGCSSPGEPSDSYSTIQHSTVCWVLLTYRIIERSCLNSGVTILHQ